MSDFLLKTVKADGTIVIIVAALILAVAVAVALLAGRFCALTTAPERHPSNWKPADRDGAS